jgi:PBP1b-binding outer membrane lipoprotein LpoB
MRKIFCAMILGIMLLQGCLIKHVCTFEDLTSKDEKETIEKNKDSKDTPSIDG